MPKTVLIVEDNELNMKLFHNLLEAQRYLSLQAKDGKETLQVAREPPPDLVVMDIKLPEVSGLEVTKWITEDDEPKSTPVIAVAAFAVKENVERVRQGGYEAYIGKPILVTEFLETVPELIG